MMMTVEQFWRRVQNIKASPAHLQPACHPRSPVTVHLYYKSREVVVSCAKCEEPILTLTVKQWHRIQA